MLPPAFARWREFAARYITALCAPPEDEDFAIAVPDDASLDALIADAPPMGSAEYLTPALLAPLWNALDQALRDELARSPLPLPDFLTSLHPAWNRVGCVHFHLTENRKDADYPFAFLATYALRLSAHGKAQHQLLSRALTEFSGGKQKAQLLSLLLPMQRAAEQCDWLRAMVDGTQKRSRPLFDLTGTRTIRRLPRLRWPV